MRYARTLYFISLGKTDFLFCVLNVNYLIFVTRTFLFSNLTMECGYSLHCYFQYLKLFLLCKTKWMYYALIFSGYLTKKKWMEEVILIINISDIMNQLFLYLLFTLLYVELTLPGLTTQIPCRGATDCAPEH